MLSSKVLVVVAGLAFVAVSGFASAAETSRVVYVGGHDPQRTIITQKVTPEAPYALTGTNEATPPQRTEFIRVGSRIIGVRTIGR